MIREHKFYNTAVNLKKKGIRRDETCQIPDVSTVEVLILACLIRTGTDKMEMLESTSGWQICVGNEFT